MPRLDIASKDTLCSTDTDRSFSGVKLILKGWIELIAGSEADLDTLHDNMHGLLAGLESSSELETKLKTLQEKAQAVSEQNVTNLLRNVLECTSARDIFWEVIAPLGTKEFRTKLVSFLLARGEGALLAEGYVSPRVRFQPEGETVTDSNGRVKRLHSPPPRKPRRKLRLILPRVFHVASTNPISDSPYK
jgi:hypothetical protein